MDLALNNLQRFICHKTNKPNQIDYDNPSSNLDETVCISHNANNHGKGVNQTILPTALGKLSSSLSSLTLIW